MGKKIKLKKGRDSWRPPPTPLENMMPVVFLLILFLILNIISMALR